LRWYSANVVDATGWQGLRFATSTDDNYGWSIGANRSTNGRGSLRIFEHNNSATGTERFTISQDGNVGIGTSAPQSPLDVITPLNGYASFSRTIGVGSYTGIHFGYREGNTLYRKSAIVFERTDNSGGGGNASGKVHILNGPAIGSGSATLADSRLTIAETGNVGIGTTAPSQKLHVAGTAFASFDFRAPIFYDSNDTSYYCDPNSTSYLDAIGRRAHHRGHLVGSYNNIGDNSSKSNPIYTIGSAYNPNDASLGNMYGIGYSYSSFFGTALAGSTWGLYVAADGDARVVLGGSTGNIGCTGNVTAYASDERLKTNIKRIEKPLEKLKLIDGVTYDWIDECEDLGFIPTYKHEHGVIAQHVQEVIPDAVKTAPFNDIATERTGEDRNYLTVDKEKIIPLLIEAIKEQQTQIEELTSQINTLKEMIK
jgi:hypothetical protein